MGIMPMKRWKRLTPGHSKKSYVRHWHQWRGGTDGTHCGKWIALQFVLIPSPSLSQNQLSVHIWITYSVCWESEHISVAPHSACWDLVPTVCCYGAMAHWRFFLLLIGQHRILMLAHRRSLVKTKPQSLTSNPQEAPQKAVFLECAIIWCLYQTELAGRQGDGADGQDVPGLCLNVSPTQPVGPAPFQELVVNTIVQIQEACMGTISDPSKLRIEELSEASQVY